MQQHACSRRAAAGSFWRLPAGGREFLFWRRRPAAVGGVVLIFCCSASLPACCLPLLASAVRAPRPPPRSYLPSSFLIPVPP